MSSHTVVRRVQMDITVLGSSLAGTLKIKITDIQGTQLYFGVTYRYTGGFL